MHITDVLSDVLNYIFVHAKDVAEVGGKEKMGEMALQSASLERVEEFEYSSEDVLVACFRFLKALTKNNIQVQRRCVMIMPR